MGMKVFVQRYRATRRLVDDTREGILLRAGIIDSCLAFRVSGSLWGSPRHTLNLKYCFGKNMSRADNEEAQFNSPVGYSPRS